MSTEVEISRAVQVPPRIENALRKAADATGVSFEYLYNTAKVESNLNPSAQAKTSSARGLFQFIESTWLSVTQGMEGVLGLQSDNTSTAQKLKMRDDPEASALMAAVFTQKNAETLKQKIGRDASYGELYMAHFLGANGASKLIDARENSPQTIAARIFPDAAAANRPIFFHKGGQPKTVGEVYAQLAAKGEPLGTSYVAGTANVNAVSALNKGDVAFDFDFVDTSKLGDRFKVAENDGNFTHSLFKTKGGVKAKVAALWGDAQGAPADGSAQSPLILKSFLKPMARS